MRFKVFFQYVALILFAVLGILAVVLERDSVFLVAFFTFASVVCTAFLISWAAEASEFSVSRGLALAVVAIVQTLPEFFVEGTIAWKAGKDLVNWEGNVIANFTGANRLLTGLGWPLILITLAVQRRRKHSLGETGQTVVRWRKEQSIEVVFLLASSLWYVAALLSLVPFSVSDLTGLVAISPGSLSVSLGEVGTIHVSAHSDQILFTMAQSLYACASLLHLEYNMRTASTLFVLWAVSTAFVET